MRRKTDAEEAAYTIGIILSALVLIALQLSVPVALVFLLGRVAGVW